MQIILDERDLFVAEELSQATYNKYKDYEGHYRNLASSHFIGRLGEMAVDKFFRTIYTNIEPHFIDENEDQLCDITTDGIRWDVKTWRSTFWDTWGRAVSAQQLELLQKKADRIAWASVDLDDPSVVTIHGWNKVSDIPQYEPVWMGPVGKQVFNHQVPINRVYTFWA